MIGWINSQGKFGPGGPAFSGLSYQQYLSLWNSLRKSGSTAQAPQVGGGPKSGLPPATQTNVEGAEHGGQQPRPV